MVSKWRGELETENGSMDLKLKTDTTKARDTISPNSVNPETGNKATAKIIDEKTGDEIGGWWNSCGKKIEIGEEEIIFAPQQLKEVKKTVLSDGFNIQKIIDKKDFDTARITKEAKQVKPQEDQETKYSLLLSGLRQTEKVLIVKYAPSTSENLYGLWSDDRGLWISQLAYPENFEYEEVDAPELSETHKEKARKLIEKAEDEYGDTEIVDRQREKIEEAIQKKMNGEDLDVEAEQEEQEQQELEEELEAVL